MTSDDGGDCYQATVDALFFGSLSGVEAVLVHGRPTLTRPPYEEFGHAWIEAGDVVFEVANGNHVAARRELYYQAGNIDPEQCFRYTPEEARRWLLSHGHYGPWEGPDACPPLEDSEDDEI